MAATVRDFTLTIGSNLGFTWPITGEAVEGGRFVLAVKGYTRFQIDSGTDAELVVDRDADPQTVTWTPTLAQSRLIPPGAVATYEMEYRLDGQEAPFAKGTITGEGGLVDDAD